MKSCCMANMIMLHVDIIYLVYDNRTFRIVFLIAILIFEIEVSRCSLPKILSWKIPDNSFYNVVKQTLEIKNANVQKIIIKKHRL